MHALISKNLIINAAFKIIFTFYYFFYYLIKNINFINFLYLLLLKKYSFSVFDAALKPKCSSLSACTIMQGNTVLYFIII
jgi:hypothetical protein